MLISSKSFSIVFFVLCHLLNATCSHKLSSSEQAMQIWNKLVGRKPRIANAGFKINYQGLHGDNNKCLSSNSKRIGNCDDTIQAQSNSRNHGNSAKTHVISLVFYLSVLLILVPFLLAIF